MPIGDDLRSLSRVKVNQDDTFSRLPLLLVFGCFDFISDLEHHEREEVVTQTPNGSHGKERRNYDVSFRELELFGSLIAENVHVRNWNCTVRYAKS